RSITRFSIDCNDGVTAVSRYLAEETARDLGTRRPIRVIPNFVNTARFRRRPDRRLRARFAEGGETLLAHVSNFRKAKRAPDVIHIFARVNARHPSRLLMVGNGPDYAICQELVKELALEGRVHFLDFVDEVERFLSISDLGIFPSELEAFGLAALEALSCQVPVITSDAGGFVELIPEGEVGYLRPVGDIEGMAERALMLLRDEALRRGMGASARRLVLESYRSEEVISLYEAFYREILGGRREEAATEAAT
ncbi:MAG: glycosyltransferase, partial [Nitrospinota bacterium]